MATTVLGDDSVPKTKFQALAGELRLLKSGMADMQGRLDALLVEIGTELEQVRKDSEPTAEVLPHRQNVENAVIIEVASAHADLPPEAEVAAEAIVIAESADAEADIAAQAESPELVTDETVSSGADSNETIVATTEATLVEAASPVMEIETVEAIGIADTSVAIEVEAVEPVSPTAEIADIAAPAELAAEGTVATETTAIDCEATPASADPVAEPIAAEVTLPDNVVVLAERRAAPRKGRSVIARTARWAAAIVLIVMAAAIAATGTGFAGNGEFLTIKDVCAIAADVCSIVPGIP
jgi:hypothetical protein